MSYHDPDWRDHPWFVWVLYGLSVFTITLTMGLVFAVVLGWRP